MAASQTLGNMGVLAGRGDEQAQGAVDPFAPVQRPRCCGMCNAFVRLAPTEAAPWRARFGNCTRFADTGALPDLLVLTAAEAPSPDGPAVDGKAIADDVGVAPFVAFVVGDVFSCAKFASGF